jgi:hypothetical protein
VQEIRNSSTEHAIYYNYQKINDSCRTVNEASTQSQENYTAMYNNMKKVVKQYDKNIVKSSTPTNTPINHHKRKMSQQQITVKLLHDDQKIVEEYFVSDYTSASKLITALNSNFIHQKPSILIRNLIVFSTTFGAYVRLHRSREHMQCCESGQSDSHWCKSVEQYRKQVHKLAIFTL